MTKGRASKEVPAKKKRMKAPEAVAVSRKALETAKRAESQAKTAVKVAKKALGAAKKAAANRSGRGTSGTGPRAR